MRQASNNVNFPYDPKDSEDIKRYAEKLREKTLREVAGREIESSEVSKNKGKLGQLVEELYFGIRNNSESEPDFREAEVELKTTPLKVKSRTGGTAIYVSKERLVLNVINYDEEYRKTFETSSFFHKNRSLLVLFYLHQKGLLDIDQVFKLVKSIRYSDLPEGDKKIIRDDWTKIVDKIKAGKAHEISEGDTMYLGACTKGTDASSQRRQPFSAVLAKQRAFAFKSRYLNTLIGLYPVTDAEPIIKDLRQLKQQQTIEEYVEELFRPFYGKTESEIVGLLGIRPPVGKGRYYDIAKAIMGVKKKKIEEFEKADILLKTIRLEHNGTLKESMSFAQIKYKGIVEEEWEESYWYETLSKRFFFVVFKKDQEENLRLLKVFFWSMPPKDLDVAREYWEDTKAKIEADNYDHFISISDDRICHVRPKAAKSSDTTDKTPSGRRVKKLCYWLNASFVKSILQEEGIV